MLAWYSIIHTPATELASVLTELYRVLCPGGYAIDILLRSALFGLGCGVNLRELVTCGARAGAMSLCAWLLIGMLGYGAVQLISL